MNHKILLRLALVLSGVSFGCSTAQTPPQSTVLAGNDVDNNLSKQIVAILTKCQTIKPGMTRAELLKVFVVEGGLSTDAHRTFVYRHCPYMKVDIDFTLSDPGQKMVEERPTDIVSDISKPYLEWSISD